MKRILVVVLGSRAGGANGASASGWYAILLSRRLLRANQEWAMDFIVDGLASGRMVRILSVINAYTRECLALGGGHSLGSGRVTRVLERLIEKRGRPERPRSDNCPEFCSQTHAGLGRGA